MSMRLRWQKKHKVSISHEGNTEVNHILAHSVQLIKLLYKMLLEYLKYIALQEANGVQVTVIKGYLRILAIG